MTTFDLIIKYFQLLNVSIFVCSFDCTDADGYKALAMQYAIYLKMNQEYKFSNSNESNTLFFVFLSSKPCPSAAIRQAHPDATQCSDPEHEQEHKFTNSNEQEEILFASKLIAKLCPRAILVTGFRNVDNVIPLKFIANCQEVYGGLADESDQALVTVSIDTAADLIHQHILTYPRCKIFMDFFGCIGYFPRLISKHESEIMTRLITVPIQGGILPEYPVTTLAINGRDLRATMNQLYDKQATALFYQKCKQYNVLLFFVTNSICNKLARFDDDIEMNRREGVAGLLGKITSAWFAYRPYLKEKYVDFDTFVFASYLLYCINNVADVTTQTRYLTIGENPAVNILERDRSADAIKVTTVTNATDQWTSLVGEILLQN